MGVTLELCLLGRQRVETPRVWVTNAVEIQARASFTVFVLWTPTAWTLTMSRLLVCLEQLQQKIVIQLSPPRGLVEGPGCQIALIKAWGR